MKKPGSPWRRLSSAKPISCSLTNRPITWTCTPAILLIEALNKYEGSLLLVSHDRYFISKTANKIWEIDDHKIREFKGTYEEWVDWKERNLAAKAALAAPGNGKGVLTNAKPAQAPANGKSTPAPTPTPVPDTKQPGVPINKEAKKELQRQQRLFQELEARIATLTQQKNRLEASLTAPATYSDKNKFRVAEADYKKASDELGKANAQYEQIFDKIVALEKTL